MPSKTINFANDVWQIVTFGPMINVRKYTEVIYINNAFRIQLNGALITKMIFVVNNFDCVYF